MGVAEEVHYYIIQGLVQDGSNFSALAMGLLQFVIKPSMQDCSNSSALVYLFPKGPRSFIQLNSIYDFL